MSDHRGYTLEAQIACVRRELALRKGVYPKWVLSGRMKAEEADEAARDVSTQGGADRARLRARIRELLTQGRGRPTQ
jgi:hypothetical protein